VVLDVADGLDDAADLDAVVDVAEEPPSLPQPATVALTNTAVAAKPAGGCPTIFMNPPWRRQLFYTLRLSPTQCERENSLPINSPASPR
jgi:hypothetical protein